MALGPIYLIIRSQAIGKKDKPWFRIASTELPRMPRVFTGYNETTNKYQDIMVQPPPAGEEWKVIMEFNNRPNEDVKIIGWTETLEEGGNLLSRSVEDALKPAREVGETIRQSWKHETDGNVSCTYHIKEPRELSDGSIHNKTYYWWEIVRVQVQHDDYGPEWHEKTRIEYMEKSAQIALDMLRKEKGELTAQEKEDLEERKKNLGSVPLSRQEFKEVMGTVRATNEEMQKRLEELDRDSEEEEGDMGGLEKAKGSKYGTVVSGAQLEDPEIMGTE